MDVSAMEVEVSTNENDLKKSKTKTKPQGGRKTTKEDTIIKDKVIIAESASVPKSDVSEKKEGKKDKKVTKSKSSRTKKVTPSTDKSKDLGEEVKPSDLNDQTEPVKEETKKTRRRGWWSKKS